VNDEKLTQNITQNLDCIVDINGETTSK